MPFHFYANRDIVNTSSYLSTCLFSEDPEVDPAWLQENPHKADISKDHEPTSDKDLGLDDSCFTRFCTVKDTERPAGSGDHDRISLIRECLDIKNQLYTFSPSNPVIGFKCQASHGGGVTSQKHPDPVFTCSAITVVSSVRTVELYSSDEYVGTFRGEPMPHSPSSDKPLFKLLLSQDRVPKRCRDLVFKFFIPKQPSKQTSNNNLILHWLVIQGTLPSSEPSSTLDTLTAIAAPTPAQPASSSVSSQMSPWDSSSHGFPPLPFLPSSFSFPQSNTSSTAQVAAMAMQGAGSGGIDLEKVRAMLGQVQLDNLPQGARELMKVMEMQASQTLPTGTSATATVPQAQFYPQGPSVSTASSDPSESLATDTGTESELHKADTGALGSREERDIYVTKAKLAQMEARIMSTIERRFQEMEDRIFNKLLAAKQKTSDNEQT